MVVVLVGTQWGDEGKGKMTDYLAQDVDVVVRYQGGANAGHTVVIEGQEYRLNLIPSGILGGKMSVIGNGVVIDPDQLIVELERLQRFGYDPNLLKISDAAHVIMPYHKSLDTAEEKQKGQDNIGTTQRGIGPAYRDKVGRVGIRVADIINDQIRPEKIRQGTERANCVLSKIYDAETHDVDDILEKYAHYAEKIRPYVCNTVHLLNDMIDNGKQLVLEGAQGTMLDIDHGSYPFVTSSNPTVGGASTGTGIAPNRISEILGLAKAYISRVGEGPFPTELVDDVGESLRVNGNEYGTTTGRPRRCGWLDAVLLRHAARINGLTGICLTKLDVLTGLKNIKIAVDYRHKRLRMANYPRDSQFLENIEPEYISLDGWDDDITNAKTWNDLPKAAQLYVETVSDLAGVPVKYISVGPGRMQTIKFDY